MVTKAQDYGNIRIFVYGTLKHAKSNNSVLTHAGATFLGYDFMALTNAAFVNLGAFPALVYPISSSKGTNTPIQIVRGEIWYGTQEVLKSCDILEGHPDFFKRSKQWTVLHEKRCWVYTLPETWLATDSDIEFKSSSVWRPSDPEKVFWEIYLKNHKNKHITQMLGEKID